MTSMFNFIIYIWRTRTSFGTTSAKGRLVVLWPRVRGPSSPLPSRLVGGSLPAPRPCSSAFPATARPRARTALEDDPSSASISYLRHSVQLISLFSSGGMRAASMLPLPSTVRYTGARLPPGPSGWTISRMCAA